MCRWEKEPREDRYKSPTFSSTLLDEIYRSMAEGDVDHQDLKFYRETMAKKQIFPKGASLKPNNRAARGEAEEEREMLAFRRACLIEKWMDQKVNEKVISQQRKKDSQFANDLDQDPLFFSSTSSSSDSSSGGFSSSETESFHGPRSRAPSCALEKPPKPLRTGAGGYSRSGKAEKTDRKTERTLLYEQREVRTIDGYSYSSGSESTPRLEESLIKSKSRALKIYGHLKKVKQPISPGGKLSSFINSLFQTGHGKKPHKSPAPPSVRTCEERKPKSGEESTCSSASSFSRSCLSKNSPSTREKLRNGVKRNVTFYPVSVIVDEDCKPCGHKNLYQEGDGVGENGLGLTSVSLPTEWRIGKSPARKAEEEQLKVQVMEQSRRVEEVAREFLKEYRHQSLKKNDSIMRDLRSRHINNHNNNNNSYPFGNDEDDDDDDDANSYSSSDLFELDHLALIGTDRYCQELPVYETTHVDTIRAIANGLIV